MTFLSNTKIERTEKKYIYTKRYNDHAKLNVCSEVPPNLMHAIRMKKTNNFNCDDNNKWCHYNFIRWDFFFTFVVIKFNYTLFFDKREWCETKAWYNQERTKKNEQHKHFKFICQWAQLTLQHLASKSKHMNQEQKKMNTKEMQKKTNHKFQFNWFDSCQVENISFEFSALFYRIHMQTLALLMWCHTIGKLSSRTFGTFINSTTFRETKNFLFFSKQNQWNWN